MALTIPTAELTGLLSDVLAFVSVVKDDPNRGVLIEWDGETLYASAYDVLSGARSNWTPGEGQEGEVDETDTDQGVDSSRWGGEDSAWRAFVVFDDAKEIVKVFKLPAKRWFVPVTVKISPTGSRLTIERTGDFGPTEALLSARVDPDRTAAFPSVDQIVSKAEPSEVTAAIGETFSPYRLAAFGTVRAHGPLELTFTDGPTTAVMGDRFYGFIWPNGARKDDALAQASAARRWVLAEPYKPEPPRPVSQSAQYDTREMVSLLDVPDGPIESQLEHVYGTAELATAGYDTDGGGNMMVDAE